MRARVAGAAAPCLGPDDMPAGMGPAGPSGPHSVCWAPGSRSAVPVAGRKPSKTSAGASDPPPEPCWHRGQAPLPAPPGAAARGCPQRRAPSISLALTDIFLLQSAGGVGRASLPGVPAAGSCHPAVHQKITARMTVVLLWMSLATSGMVRYSPDDAHGAARPPLAFPCVSYQTRPHPTLQGSASGRCRGWGRRTIQPRHGFGTLTLVNQMLGRMPTTIRPPHRRSSHQPGGNCRVEGSLVNSNPPADPARGNRPALHEAVEGPPGNSQVEIRHSYEVPSRASSVTIAISYVIAQ